MSLLENFEKADLHEDEAVWERRFKALTLRNAGATFTQIAQKCEVSPAQARRDVAAALREVIAETAEDMIARQRSVILDLQRANYAAALGGDVDAARVILASMEREAKLFGLDAPAKVSIGVSDIEFAEKTAALIADLGLQPPKELTGARAVPVAEAVVVSDPAEQAQADVPQLAVKAPVLDAEPPAGPLGCDDTRDPQNGAQREGPERLAGADAAPCRTAETDGWSNL